MCSLTILWDLILCVVAGYGFHDVHSAIVIAFLVHSFCVIHVAHPQAFEAFDNDILLGVGYGVD